MVEDTNTVQTIMELISDILKSLAILIPTVIGVWYTWEKNIKIKKMQSDAPMAEHLIHTEIDGMIRKIETNFSLKDKAKEAMWRDLILAKLKIWKKVLYDYSKEIDSCTKKCKSEKLSCPVFFNISMKYFNNGIEEYSNYFRNNNYTFEEQECLSIAMQKFAVFHQPKVDLVSDAIREVSENDRYYANCMLKGTASLNAYLHSLEFAMIDFYKGIDSLNGDLNGKKFRGLTIGVKK